MVAVDVFFAGAEELTLYHVVADIRSVFERRNQMRNWMKDIKHLSE